MMLLEKIQKDLRNRSKKENNNSTLIKEEKLSRPAKELTQETEN